MKKIISFVIAAFAVYPLNAQAFGKPANDYLGANSVKDLQIFDASGKKITTADEFPVQGTPMVNEKFGKGFIKFKNGKQVADTAINFSIYENLVFHIQGDRIFALTNPPIAEFTITYTDNNDVDMMYHFKNGYPMVDKNNENIFYQVLYEGKDLDLVCFLHKSILEKMDYGATHEKYFSETQQYYVFSKTANKMMAVGTSANTFKKVMPDYAAAIDSYASSHKINGKDKKSLIGLAEFMDNKK
jgi:hypothetical protein